LNLVLSQLSGSHLVDGQNPKAELIPHLLGNDPLTYQFSETTNFVFQEGDQPTIDVVVEGADKVSLDCTLSGYSQPATQK
jgi:hypothetical protein